MKNKLIDLNDHLFEALERLNDDEIVGEELETEIKRSKAITGVATVIVNNASVILDAQKHMDNNGYTPHRPGMPSLLLSSENLKNGS